MAEESGFCKTLKCLIAQTHSGFVATFVTVFAVWGSLIGPSAALAETTWQSPLLQAHPLVGRFVSAEGESLSYGDLLPRLAQSSLLLIGEKHDNPDHHRLEARLLRDLVDGNTAVVFEMLDDRHVSTLSDLSAGASRLSLDRLQQLLQWPEKGWPWSDYGPLFLQVLQQQGQLLAGNIDRSRMMGIYAQGLASLGQEALRSNGRFASAASLQTALEAPIVELVYDSHCGKMPRDKLQPMMQIQLAKDASMAFALTSAATPRRILIAGGVHARKDVGVPQHLAVTGGRRVQEDSLTLLMLEVQPDKFEPEDYPALTHGQADIVWFSPQLSDQDYCSRL